MTPSIIKDVYLVLEGLVVGRLPYSLFANVPDFPQNTPEIECEGRHYRVLGINRTTINMPDVLAVNVENVPAPSQSDAARSVARAPIAGGNRMIVKELIEELRKMPQDAVVIQSRLPYKEGKKETNIPSTGGIELCWLLTIAADWGRFGHKTTLLKNAR